MADLLCVEHSIMPAVANVQNDQRRLSILLRNELLYAPTPSYLERVQSSLVIDESKRKELLTQVYDVSVTVVLRNCVFGEYPQWSKLVYLSLRHYARTHDRGTMFTNWRLISSIVTFRDKHLFLKRSSKL